MNVLRRASVFCMSAQERIAFSIYAAPVLIMTIDELSSQL